MFLLEKTSIGVVLLDLHGRYMEVNLTFADSIGYTAEEVIGLHYSDVSCPLFLNKDNDKFSQIVNGEINSFFSIKQYFKKNGKSLYLRVNVISVYSKRNNCIQIIGLYQISRPFYFSYLPLLHPDFADIIRNNPDPGIFMFGEDDRILFSSASSAKCLGYSERDLSRMSLKDIIDGEQVQGIVKSFSCISSRKFIDYEFNFQRCDNIKINVDAKIFIDESNYYKNGSILIVIFKEKFIFPDLMNCSKWENHENRLFSEIEDIRNMLRSISTVDVFKYDSTSIINLSDYNLTDREREVLLHCLDRKNAKEIAYEMSLAEITIRKYFTSLYRKFDVTCREDLLLLLNNKKIVR